MQSVEERILQLERENQMLRADVEKLRAGKFETIRLSGGLQILDKNSKVRIAFMLLDDEPAFAFLNANGQIVIAFTLDDDAPEISLNDATGKVRLKAKINGEGEPMVIMTDESESPRLSLSVIKDSPRVMLHDQNQKMRVVISLEPFPHIRMNDASEKPRVNLSIDGDQSEVCIINSRGKKTGGL